MKKRKTSMDRLHSKTGMTQGKLSEFQDTTIEITQAKQ
jgi:hypothetical protein